MTLLDDSLIATLEAISATLVKKGASSHGMGNRKGILRGGNEEFADYRPYQRGDDFRRIDWKPFLRFNELVTKVFARSTSGNVHVVVDTSASMDVPEQKSTYARKIAALLGYLALCGSDRLTAWGVAEGNALSLGPIEGKQNIHRLMEFLSNLSFSGTTNISASLASTIMEIPGRPEVMIVSDLLDESDMFNTLRLLAQKRANIVLIHVMDRSEYAPLPLGNARIEDSETGEVINRWIGEEAVEEYKRLFAARVEELHAKAASLHIGHYTAKTDESLKDLALKLCK